MKLATVLPDFARELLQGLSAMGHNKLAESVANVEIVERCECEQPGCITFYTMPKDSISSQDWSECERAISPAAGISCVYYQSDQIRWIEALGRPADRKMLDSL